MAVHGNAAPDGGTTDDSNVRPADAADGADAADANVPDASVLDLGCKNAGSLPVTMGGAGATVSQTSSALAITWPSSGGTRKASARATFSDPSLSTYKRVVIAIGITIDESGTPGSGASDYLDLGAFANGTSADDPFFTLTNASDNLELDMFADGAADSSATSGEYSDAVPVPRGAGAKTLTVEIVWGPSGRVRADFGGTPMLAYGGPVGAAGARGDLVVTLGGTADGTIADATISYTDVCVRAFSE